ncbi:MAG: ABC transporter substrate-binding protein [Deltaproteobacteria bacterium]|nr:ABC transporter substrate-binding protein [Deltaproteobacteria bacterium]
MKKPDRLLRMFWLQAFLSILMVGTVFADNIKVGVLLPLTGKLAGAGEIEQKSFVMAVDEINAAGGVAGRKIDLIIEDTATKPDVGGAAIEKLISQDRVIVVGGGCSSPVTRTVAAKAQELEVPFLINTASAEELTETKRKYVFRLNPPASEYSGILVSFLTKVARVKTVAILYENTGFGRFGVKGFYKVRRKLNLRVIIKRGYDASTLDFRPLLAMVKARNPDLVYIVSHNILNATLLMQQADELSLHPRLFLGSAAGFTLPEFQEYTGDASEYAYSSTIWSPSVPYPGTGSFYDRFVAKYGTYPGYHGAQAYAAMYVITDALKRAKSFTPIDVRDALAGTDMMTVFGPVKFISYGKKTQQNRLPTYLAQWINGRLEIVWPREVATARYVYPAPN